MLDKYYGLQAISEILDKQENKYKDTLEKGMNVNIEESGLCNRVNNLMNKIKINDSSHDWHHILRVKNLSATIANKEMENGKKVNLIIVMVIALLHETIDSKYCINIDEKIKEIEGFLESKGIEKEDINNIINGIHNISYRKEIGKSEEERKTDLEVAIVQDADKLDAMGAIGISRCLAYSGAKSRPFYDPDIPPKINMTQNEYIAQSKSNGGTAINHFYEKLFKLKDMMKTDYGKHMAKERDKYMREFDKLFNICIDIIIFNIILI